MKGYFYHLHPEFIPTAYDFTFVRALVGIDTDAAFTDNWLKVIHIKRGVYQNPVVTPENDAYQHAAWLADFIQNNLKGNVWQEMPIVINATALNVDLMFLDTWITRLNDQLQQPFPKPLIYIAKKQWDTITDAPDALVVTSRILQKAGIFWSEWNVSQPQLPRYCAKKDVQYWEYTKGVILYDANGQFSTQPTPTPDPTPNPTPTPNGSTDVNIHLNCPYCGKKIF
jgi:hypothetical protein